ncbi:ABC transporter permease subunit [Niabella beijingensis]|uniref:ABC transporter permease subunit n=1 Tax=Niabella beijingensis TaxID=2872700 RepID=UPI001CBEFC1A|nr:Gldg family protein [Niabella beijingensis]MBZ4189383.1 Gldg family protein [Niabella beijingensis]
MKLIVNIAKNELRNLVFSPVAWFLAITFLVMCGFFYTAIMYPSAKQAFFMLNNMPKWTEAGTVSMTVAVFQSFFFGILPHIYLFIPLLTMGIINREVNNGTIKLLYAAPVTLWQIVWGKYLALMVFNLLFILIIGIFVISGFSDIRSLDYPPLLAALSGYYLLLCALTAIGFFMSSLTTHQVVAAIASFTVLFILSRIGMLWQQYELVRDLTWFLSINNRIEWMLKGLIRSKDVMYYLVIIFMFVGFTLLKLSAGRGARPWYVKASRYLVVVVAGLLIGYTASRPRFMGYWDLTATKANTIHPRTQSALKELGDSTLEVTLYTNLLDPDVKSGLPESRNIYLDKWEHYVRFKPDIRFKYEYYYNALPEDSFLYKKFPGKTLKQISGLVAKQLQVDPGMFKSPEEMRKQTDLSAVDYRLAMQLKYKGRSTFLSFLPTAPGIMFEEGSIEPNLIAALKRLTGSKIPKVAFISGELERNIYKKGEREYDNHALARRALPIIKQNALINLGFDVDTLNLVTGNITDDITTIVLADPKKDLDPVVFNKLKTYINNGRNMLVLGEPGKQYVLNPLLKELGVQLMPGQLVQPGPDETPDKVDAYMERAYFDLAEEYWFLLWRHLIAHDIHDSTVVKLQGITGVAHEKNSDFYSRPLLGTMPDKAWLAAGKLITDSVAPVFDPQRGDTKQGSYPVALLLTRQKQNKEQRIAVYGDADAASNLRLNGDLIRSLYSWLNYNRFPVYTPLPYAKDNLVLRKPAGAAMQKIIYIWALPGMLLIAGTILLVRRKRK